MNDEVDLGPRVRLVRLQSDSGARLDGALHEPTGGVPPGGAVVLHGKGGNFYTNLCRELPPRLAEDPGLLSLAANMHSHDLGYSLPRAAAEERPWGAPRAAGGMWEHLASGHLDVAAAVDAMRTLTDGPVLLVAHSSAAYFAVDYVRHGGRPDALALLSPLMTNRTAFSLWFSSDAKRDDLVDRARALVANGHGHRLLPLLDWYYAISAASLVERADEDPAVWAEGMARVSCPLFMAWSSDEPRAPSWDAAFSAAPGTSKRRLVMDGAGHHYRGHEDELAAELRAFFSRAAVATTDAVGGTG